MVYKGWSMHCIVILGDRCIGTSTHDIQGSFDGNNMGYSCGTHAIRLQAMHASQPCLSADRFMSSGCGF